PTDQRPSRRSTSAGSRASSSLAVPPRNAMSKLNRFKGVAGRAFGAGAQEERPTVVRDAGAAAHAGRLPGARLIPIDALESDPSQPRKRFPAAPLQELASSIREHGILQPLLVTREGDEGIYRIVAGERRFKAARLAGLTHVPCLVTESLGADLRL